MIPVLIVRVDPRLRVFLRRPRRGAAGRKAARSAPQTAHSLVGGGVTLSGLRRRFQRGAQPGDAWVVRLEAAQLGGPHHIAHDDAQPEVVADAVLDRDAPAARAGEALHLAADLVLAGWSHGARGTPDRPGLGQGETRAGVRRGYSGSGR